MEVACEVGRVLPIGEDEDMAARLGVTSNGRGLQPAQISWLDVKNRT